MNKKPSPELPAENAPLSVSFKTAGCRLNQAETAELSSLFAKAGFAVKPFGAQTDVVVIHTCTVTERAEQDCLRIARVCKQKKPAPLVILAGCAAEVDKAGIEKASGADLVIGQKDKFLLPEKISSMLNRKTAGLQSPFRDPSRTRAIIKVQSGCNFNCTYCIVPKARGRPRNESVRSILSKTKELARQGVKEVILSGTNLGCFSSTSGSLVELIESIEKIEGINRIRLSSIELTTAERDLVQYMKHSRKVCRHLHIPLQSGCNSVLARMNRKYSSVEYADFCSYALSELPGLAIGTDVITGFPGETDSEFKTCLRFIEQIPFSNIHVFTYSPRSGTPAAAMQNPVPNNIKKSRSALLLKLAEQKKQIFAETLIGKNCEVLVEKLNKSGRSSGWTQEYIRADFAAAGAGRNDIISFTAAHAQNGTLSD